MKKRPATCRFGEILETERPLWKTPLFKGVLFGHLIDLSIDVIRICKTKGMMPEQIRVHSYQILSVKKQRVPQSCP